MVGRCVTFDFCMTTHLLTIQSKSSLPDYVTSFTSLPSVLNDVYKSLQSTLLGFTHWVVYQESTNVQVNIKSGAHDDITCVGTRLGYGYIIHGYGLTSTIYTASVYVELILTFASPYKETAWDAKSDVIDVLSLYLYIVYLLVTCQKPDFEKFNLTWCAICKLLVTCRNFGNSIWPIRSQYYSLWQVYSGWFWLVGLNFSKSGFWQVTITNNSDYHDVPIVYIDAFGKLIIMTYCVYCWFWKRPVTCISTYIAESNYYIVKWTLNNMVMIIFWQYHANPPTWLWLELIVIIWLSYAHNFNVASQILCKEMILGIKRYGHVGKHFSASVTVYNGSIGMRCNIS